MYLGANLRLALQSCRLLCVPYMAIAVKNDEMGVVNHLHQRTYEHAVWQRLPHSKLYNRSVIIVELL